MDDSRPSQRKRNFLVHYVTVSSLLAGAMIRWFLAFIVYPADEHIFSDMNGYVTVAGRILDPNHHFNPFDMVQGIGTPTLLAACIKWGGTLQYAKMLWWLLSSMTPVMWTIAAILFPVRGLSRSRREFFILLVATLTSFDVSHIKTSNVFMPESPFAFLIATGCVALLYSMTAGVRGRRWLGLIAGLVWSIATLFRGHGVVMLLACILPVLTGWFISGIRTYRYQSSQYKNQLDPARVSLTLAGVGMIIGLIVSGSFFQWKIGRFAVSALNGPTNILIGHVLEAKEVRFEVRNMYHTYGNPAVHQRMPEATYVFPFSIIDSKSAIPAIKNLFLKDPIQYVYLSFKNAWQTFAGNYPWPAIVMPTSRWLQLYESIFLLFALLPALATLLMELSNWRDQSGQSWAVFFLGLQLVGLWFISFMVIGETRYRVPFDGVILILASLTWTRLFLKKDIDQRLNIAPSVTS